MTQTGNKCCNLLILLAYLFSIFLFALVACGSRCDPEVGYLNVSKPHRKTERTDLSPVGISRGKQEEVGKAGGSRRNWRKQEEVGVEGVCKRKQEKVAETGGSRGVWGKQKDARGRKKKQGEAGGRRRKQQEAGEAGGSRGSRRKQEEAGE